MEFAVDDEHRAGLGREAGRVVLEALRVSKGFGHAGLAVIDPENAVREHAEIAGAGIGDEAHLGLFFLDIKADRAAVLMVHAGVHREDEAAALAGDVVREPVELAKRRAGIVAQEQADVVGLRVEAADQVGRAFIGDRLARTLIGLGAGRQDGR